MSLHINNVWFQWNHPNCDRASDKAVLYLDCMCNDFDKYYCQKCYRKDKKNFKTTFKNVENTQLRACYSLEDEGDQQYREKYYEDAGFVKVDNVWYHPGGKKKLAEIVSQEFIKQFVQKYRESDEFRKAEVEFDHKKLETREWLNGATKIDLKLSTDNQKYWNKYGFCNPIYFPPGEKPEGLKIGITKRDQNGMLEDIKGHVGPGITIKYIDTLDQEEYWCELEDFIEYKKGKAGRVCLPNVENPNGRKLRINVISLEYTKTNMAMKNIVKAPLVMRETSWVQKYWPKKTTEGKDVIDTKDEPPSFMNYCLMSDKDSFTEWHVDFGGTSVWYHVYLGEKVFVLVKPTEKNLETFRRYETWNDTRSEDGLDHPHPEKLYTPFIEYAKKEDRAIPKDEILVLTLVQGSTVLLPSGWIHCVYTPEGTIIVIIYTVYTIPRTIDIRKNFRLNCFRWELSQFILCYETDRDVYI